MDGKKFDDIIRRMAAGTSRRSLLKRGVATVAGLAGIGGVAAADAARRPTPTPKPVTCPGTQTWNGSACVCPGGTTQCGSACCPVDAPCCDGACCAGTCYGEELCCPTGQIVCNGVCLAAGQCCTSDNCGPGLACIGNACICQPTTSCATAGLLCGTFTDDCGAIHDCGTCSTPQTCGGGGTAGVCGCISTMSCEGKCGSVTTECGTVLECGSTCGSCQSCVQNACVAVADGTACTGENCTQGATCVAGQCQGGIPVVCQQDPSDPCNTVECDPTLGCVKVRANDGGDCTTDPCVPSRCESGTCIGLDMECPPCHSCAGGQCVQSDDGEVCGDGLHCYAGNCCNMPTIGGEVPLAPSVLGACQATDQICCDASAGACCPAQSGAVCCDICVTYTENGLDKTKCCEPEQICGEDCCWLTDTCVAGRCVNRNMVCAGDIVCDDKCCGGSGDGTGTCCGADAYCVNGACVPQQGDACVDHETCAQIYGSGAVCAYMSINLGTGQVSPGTCCPGGYSRLNTSGPSAGQYSCCDPNTHPTQMGCCAYPDSDCLNCTCSRVSIRRWGH